MDIPDRGTLADVAIQDDTYQKGFLAFIWLVSTVYYKKHQTGFEEPSPARHFLTYVNTHVPGLKMYGKQLLTEPPMTMRWYHQQKHYTSIGKGHAGFSICGAKPTKTTWFWSQLIGTVGDWMATN